ncbi:MAG: N-acetylmuramoyl-L-alanine amidase [Clostridia bacterium]|nr:N-acetylmuramoyl-L-alanine amidase [Clostridia bacterium]
MKRLILIVLILLTSVVSVRPAYAAFDLQNYKQTDLVVRVNGSEVALSQKPVEVNGDVLVPAISVFKRLGVSVIWYPGSRIKMNNNGTKISMRVGDRSIFVNGVRKKLSVPPVVVNGAVMVPVKQVSEVFKARISMDNGVLGIYDYKSRMKILEGNIAVPFVVVIDPGHGGKDPGAVYSGIREKDLNLDISKRLNLLLKEEGIKTYMTRFDDRFLGLYDRSALANRVNADLLISVHNNAAGSSSTWGSMSLYYPGRSNFNGRLTARSFASIVQKEMTDKLSTFDWGEIERPKLAVLRTANMPAVIAEVGYMTNAKELKKLMDPDYRQDAAEALKNAVLKALDKI